MKDQIVVEGEVFLQLETVAEYYRVEVSWLEEVVDLGLLGSGRVARGRVVIAAIELDRVARIVQLCLHQGVSLEGASLLLDLRE